MADGTLYLSPQVGPQTRSGLLFPVAPRQGETLLGYLVRCVERNYLESPVQFLRRAGIDLSISGDFLGRLQRSLPDLCDLIDLTLDDASSLWGSEPPDELGRRRLGGVFLRPSLIDQARRRVAPSLARGEGDRAIWMVRHFDFCPHTWHILVRSCPNRFCRKPLTWPRADSLDTCRHCRELLTHPRPEKVPKSYRPVLAWLAGLFDDCDERRIAALNRVPAVLRMSSETDVYELVLAMVHARFLLGDDDPEDSDAACTYQSLHAAARFVLDYPRSRWDMLQDRPAGQRDKLYGIIARIVRDTPVPVVRDRLTDILSDDRLRVIVRQDRRPPPGELTSRGAAQLLGVPPGDVRRLVDAGLLVPLSTSGSRRKQHLFNWSAVEGLKDELESGLSWRSIASMLHVPEYAVPQFVALGVLKPIASPASLFLRGDRRVRAEEANGLAQRLDQCRTVEPSNQWMPLSQAMKAVGGREKPWAPVIMAGLAGYLPGGLVHVGSYFCPGALSMSRLTAEALIAGGPDVTSPLRFDYLEYGVTPPETMKPGAVVEFLNCSAVELAWLKERGLLLPVKWTAPSRYEREAVEAFGRQWMSTREAAARLDVEPLHLWRYIETYPLETSIGRGFYPRADFEAVVRRAMPKPTWNQHWTRKEGENVMGL